MFKRFAAFALAVLIGFTGLCSAVDVYDFRMRLKVPRVYDNTDSLGYRKYQTQTIKGRIAVTYDEEERYPQISFLWMTNMTHKVGKSYVSYDAKVSDDVIPRMNFIGNNKTGVFKTPTMIFGLVCEPSYALTEANEDNSLYLVLAGFGTSKVYKGARVASFVSGNVAGSIGCGCSDYGHTSPTRVAGECGPECDEPDDVCAVKGTWNIRHNAKLSCRNCYK